MKLSEAVREGAKQTSPWTGELFTHLPGGEIACCALGGALFTVIGKEELEKLELNPSRQYGKLFETFPELGSTIDGAPHVTSNLTIQIWTWSDVDHLSREQIADRLQRLGY